MYFSLTNIIDFCGREKAAMLGWRIFEQLPKPQIEIILIDTSTISIATMTLVRDAEEDLLLRESLTALAKYNIPVHITDGGSPNDFLEFLHQFPNFIIADAPAKGLFQQVSNSLRNASKSGSEAILYTEPDKKFFFRMLDDFLDNASFDEGTGVLLASRSEAGFASYPAFQHMSETCINNCCRELIGEALDYTYGPFLLHRSLVPYLDIAEPGCAWGWRPYVFGMAHRLGMKVKEYKAEYFCPPEQRQDTPEERIYRMKQMVQSVNGAIFSGVVNISNV